MTDSGTTQAPERSIHWRQRWWYALWVTLLLGAAGFWAWWETPAVSGKGHVVLKVWVAGLPAGTHVEAWTGPAKEWGRGGVNLQGPWTVDDPARPLPLPPFEIQAGLRRFHQGYIPRLTSDLIVLRLDPPQGPPRFIAYDLAFNIRTGLAGPHRRLQDGGAVRWASLSEDASRPSPLLP